MSTEPIKQAPDIQELKALLREITSQRGTQTTIANMLGLPRGATDISHRFNPAEARKPALFEGLREAWAVAVASPEAGRKLQAYINILFGQWIDPAKPTDKNVTALVQDMVREAVDMGIARWDARPVNDQMDRALAIQQITAQIIVGLQQQFELRGESDSSRFSKRA